MTLIDTLKFPYYEFMLGISTNSFFDLIIMGEWVEKEMKKRKVVDSLVEVANPKKIGVTSMKKNSEVYIVC